MKPTSEKANNDFRKAVDLKFIGCTMLDLIGKTYFQCLLSRQDGTITSNGEKIVGGSFSRIPPHDLDSGTPEMQKAPTFQGDSSNVEVALK